MSTIIKYILYKPLIKENKKEIVDGLVTTYHHKKVKPKV